MNEKGFTLIELMGVLILLVLLITVSVSGIITARDKANNSIDKATTNLIIAGATRFATDKNIDVPACIKVEYLLNEDYLKDPIVNDTKKNALLLTKYVKVTANDKGILNYEVVDTCSATNMFE